MDSLSFFRRNLKPIMAALTLMSMISFVFLDDTMKAGTTFLVPLILAALFGGGAFVWGTRRAKQNEYGTMGALVGAVLGLVITTFSDRDTTEQPPIAGLSQREIASLKGRRESANRILGELYRKSHPIPEQFLKAGPFGQQFYDMQVARALEQIQFKFGNDDFEKDVIFGDLLRREAVRLGINVNDDAVTDFMKMISDQNLTKEMFRDIKQQLHVGDHYIYDLFRDELAARMAAEMTFPRAVSTPQQRWQDFRKVNVKQSIEATTIPVEAFAKSVPDPTNDQLLAFFKKHAEKVPGSKGEPGFFQPMRVRLAYLEADYDDIEKSAERPTDEEVAKYYEENKEFFADRTPVKTDEKKDDATEGDDPKKPEEKKDGEKKEGDKPDPDKPDESKKGDDKPKGESKGGDKPEKPSDPKSDKPTDEKSDTPKEDKPKDEKPAEKPKPDDPQGAAGEDKVTAEKPEEAKPADKPKKEEPKAEGDPKDAPKANTEKTEKKEDAKSEDKKDEKPKPETTDSKDKPAAEAEKSDKPDEKPDEKTEKKPETKYKPFEEVKDKIFDDLLRERTLKLMKERIESVIGDKNRGMRRLGSYTIAEKGSKSYRSPQDVASELKDFAKSLDLKYVETPLLSAEELSKSEEHKIGGATDPMDESFNRQQGAATVIQRVFGRGSDATFTPEVAEDPGTKNRFAYWVVERKEAHVPKFDEDGIRQQVTKAWKLAEAAPKAEERAKALAKLATDGQKLTEVLAGQTVTGDKDGLQLTVIEPKEKFSHFTMQGMSAPGVNPLQPGNERVELTQIPGLDKLGDDFFTAIDQMKPGETATIPNFDRSAFIVVHITDREDIAAEEDAPQRADFLKTWLFSPPANELANASFFPLRREWMESIERKYNVKWPVK
ncbi:MAG: hypothetical protein IAG10_01045 [Planctomycetaceae bacterium]|nr:hypothetical protein [Planctomycetaceae bacterium]